MKRLTTLITVLLLVLGLGSTQVVAKPKPRPVNVMTRNLYLGADLTPAIAAASIPELLAATSSIWTTVQATDFPQRAEALAREIADADPHMIGLQEAAVWFSGDFGSPAQATTVEYDFLDLLTDALEDIGHPYDIAGVQDEADLEATAGAPYYRDFRLLQRDAILVKASAGVQLTNLQQANFVNNLVIPTGTGAEYAVTRGWLSVDAVVNKRAFRFVNTHLEAFSWYHRMLQAGELLAGPVATAPGPVVLVGDLNSGPDLPDDLDELAFGVLTGGGMVDSWAALYPDDPGYTSGYSETLDDPDDMLEHRIDHVMVSSGVDVYRMKIYGTDGDLRTSGGLWPSDHAGVKAAVAP
jgi:endonuclease/exonuclease/phosphatase family metal-dependent hydrolase